MSENEMNTNKETFWSRFAADFEKRNNYVIEKREIENLKEDLLQNEDLGNVLELGCGDGVFSKSISQNSDFLLATDWSDEMIKSAMANLVGFESIKVQKENCFELSFKDESFDTVFMANLLHIITDPEKVIAESRRVLKPNGQIIILSFTLHGMNFFHKLGMLYRYFKTYGKPPKESRVLTVSVVKQMLEDKQFLVQKADLIGFKMKSVLVVAKK
jgi:ubiquinone/menaquinone biosynthesis C-methylase UbiE